MFKQLNPPYGLIMADPAWSFKHHSKKGHKKSAEGQYRTMSDDEIKAMPVHELAADDCFLFLWATNPKLDVAIDTLKEWGFTFKTAGTWVKMSKRWRADMWKDGLEPKQHFGTGYTFRSANEPFIIGVRGKPRAQSKRVRGAIMAAVREHSRKPEEAFSVCEQLFPDAKKLELFSRQLRAGWDTWGDQNKNFDERKIK